MKKMKRFLAVVVSVLFVVVLSACDLTITPSVPANITPLPFPTSALPTATQPVAPSPSPTADPNYFRDDFKTTLQPGWFWVREVPEQWSLLKTGGLQIYAGRGNINAETISNLFLRPAPTGDFQIETKVLFSPYSNFQFAGLIIYNSPGNFIQAGHGYCFAGVCVREGIYMDHYRNGLLTPPNFAQPYTVSDVVILRLIRKGNEYTLQMSGDGQVFYVVGSHENDMTPLQVGLLAGQNLTGDPFIPAVFDYFEITSAP